MENRSFEGYANRAMVERSLNKLMDELFELEFQETSRMTTEEVQYRASRIRINTANIERQREILDSMPAYVPKVVVPEAVVPADKTSALTVALVIIIGIVVFAYTNTAKDVKHLEEILDTQKMINAQGVSRANRLKDKLSNIENLHTDLGLEYKVLDGQHTLLGIYANKITEENSIAWRWYDRHVEKIKQLEAETVRLKEKTSTPTGQAYFLPDSESWCVAQAEEVGGTFRCRNSTSGSVFLITLKTTYRSSDNFIELHDYVNIDSKTLLNVYKSNVDRNITRLCVLSLDKSNKALDGIPECY